MKRLLLLGCLTFLLTACKGEDKTMQETESTALPTYISYEELSDSYTPEQAKEDLCIVVESEVQELGNWCFDGMQGLNCSC